MSSPAPRRPHVVVIGSGLIGTLSTYYLSLSGHYSITCMDRGLEPCAFTSKRNAGRFCPSLFADFAPKLDTLSSVFLGTSSSHGVSTVVQWNAAVVKWGTRFVWAAAFERDRVNHTMFALGGLCERLTNGLVAEWNIPTVHPNVWVFDEESQLIGAMGNLKKWPGAKFQRAGSVEECVRLTGFAKHVFGTAGGCIKVDSDFTADAKEFTLHAIEASKRNKGVKFRFGVSAESIVRENGRVVGVMLSDGSIIDCDVVVYAGGPWSAKKLLGRELPIMPLRGCSIQLEGVKNRPDVGSADYASKSLHFQITPIGKDSLRLVGFADVVQEPKPDGLECECPPHYKQALMQRLREALPQVSWADEGKTWCGIRPVSPDRVPVIGPVSQDVFVNCGQGAMGWTMAAASGYLLCNSVLKSRGEAPLGIDPEGDAFDLARVSLDRFTSLY